MGDWVKSGGGGRRDFGSSSHRAKRRITNFSGTKTPVREENEEKIHFILFCMYCFFFVCFALA